jgi:hypothetical protein
VPAAQGTPFGGSLHHASGWDAHPRLLRHARTSETIFAAEMTAWLIAIAADKQITGWSLPAAIFALAVFAASPTVLLLRERPLRGIDEWMPNAKGSETGDAPTSSAGAATSAGGDEETGATA